MMAESLTRFSIDESLARLIRSIRLLVFDFDGVFTDNRVYVSQDGTESVCCYRSDGLGLKKLRRLNIQMMILSTEPNPVVAVRSKKMEIPCIHGCDNKKDQLNVIINDHNVTYNQTAFVGNDINDLECLAAVGLPIVVQDSHPDVWPYAKYKTTAKGGKGAVREVCDLFEWVHDSHS